MGSATGIRTPVYGVRGRCPRPLDDSTINLSTNANEKQASNQRAAIKRHFSIASAKVLLFFELAKFLSKKMQKNVKKAKIHAKMHNFSLIFWRNEIFSVTL